MLNTNLLEDFKNLKVFIILSLNLIDIVLNGVKKNKWCIQRERKKKDVIWSRSLFKIDSPPNLANIIFKSLQVAK